MLQTVVADDDVHRPMQEQQLFRCRHSVAPDRHRHAASSVQQQGLVTAFGGGCGFVNFLNRVAASTVAARDDPRAKTVQLQQGHHRDHGGRFARPTNDEIAHHDHRHGQAVSRQNADFEKKAPKPNHPPHDHRHREQRAS